MLTAYSWVDGDNVWQFSADCNDFLLAKKGIIGFGPSLMNV